MSRSASSEDSVFSMGSDSTALVGRSHGFSAGPAPDARLRTRVHGTLHDRSSAESSEDWATHGAAAGDAGRAAAHPFPHDARSRLARSEDHVEPRPFAGGIPPAPPPAAGEPFDLDALSLGAGRSPFAAEEAADSRRKDPVALSGGLDPMSRGSSGLVAVDLGPPLAASALALDSDLSSATTSLAIDAFAFDRAAGTELFVADRATVVDSLPIDVGAATGAGATGAGADRVGEATGAPLDRAGAAFKAAAGDGAASVPCARPRGEDRTDEVMPFYDERMAHAASSARCCSDPATAAMVEDGCCPALRPECGSAPGAAVHAGARAAELPARASQVDLCALVRAAREAPAAPLCALAAACGIPAAPLPAPTGLEAPSAALESLRRTLAASPSDTAYVYDLGHTARAVAAFRRASPRATPHYAVKCNPTPALVAALGAAGAGFDCASLAEIRLVLSLGVQVERIVYAHPCKPPEQLAEAHRLGVPLTVVDGEAEVAKLARHAPGMPALVRVRADDPAARCSLGTKFGAEPVLGTRRVARAAARLGVPLAGVAFHVGSGSQGRGAYAAALAAARVAWLELVEAGHAPTVLDLGGGFPGARIDASSIAGEAEEEAPAPTGSEEAPKGGVAIAVEACACEVDPPGVLPSRPRPSARSSSASSASLVALARSPRLLNHGPLEEASAALDELFPAELHPSLRVLAEPGRFFAEPAAAFAARVIGVRERRDHARGQDVFLADGVYGSLNNVIYDHAVVPTPTIFRDPAQPDAGAQDAPLATALFGPTCDGIDVLARDAPLPPLRVGDWLAFDRWGAYTIAGAVDFNGFAVSTPDIRLCWGVVDP